MTPTTTTAIPDPFRGEMTSDPVWILSTTENTFLVVVTRAKAIGPLLDSNMKTKMLPKQLRADTVS